MIAHLVYFEVLADMEDNDPQWKAVSAGLVVMRLLDAWLDDGPQVVTTDVTQLRTIRESVEAIPAGDPIRSILNGILDTVQDAETASVKPLASQLLAYGRALHYAGFWSLAKDVFVSLLQRAEIERDSALCVQAALRLGFVSRRLGELEDSDSAYELANKMAKRSKNSEGRLRARLGLAQNTIERGNLPKADELLAEIIADPEQTELPAVLADSLHARAHLCHMRKDFASAVRYGYSALEYAPDLLVRDRILGDIAAAFGELGNWSAARDSHLIVLATTQETWLRQQTMVNLLDIAIQERQEPAFHGYRSQLLKEDLQPFIKGYFHLYSARGYRTFGQVSRAESEYVATMTVASNHNLSQLQITAEMEMEQLATQPVEAAKVLAAPDAEKSWSPEIEQIAVAIGELRELATTAQKIGAA